MPGAAALEKKASYLKRLHSLTQEFSKILIVNADNVRSSQMQRIRLALRGKAEVLFGKNTLIRNGLKKFVGENPALEVLIPLMRGNVGYIFTNADLKEIKDIIGSERVGAPARAGAVAPVDVWVPAGNTGIEPTQTAFFQALNIPTKISKGAIEILKDVQVVFKDTKVGASEATLLQKLKIQPFTYGLETEMVYDNGEVYSAAVLDLTEEDLLKYFSEAVNNVACLSLGTGHGTLASAPHNFVEAYKNVLALAIGTEQTFPLGEKVITLALDPEAAAAAAAAASAAAAPAAAGGGEAAKDEPEEEEDEDMGFGLFD